MTSLDKPQREIVIHVPEDFFQNHCVINEAGSPRAVAGIMLWHLMTKRIPCVLVRIVGTKVTLLDSAGEPVALAEHGNPSVLATQAEVEAFMRTLESESGWLRWKRRRIIPSGASPPPVLTYMHFETVSATELAIRFEYGIPSWRWHIRKWLFRIGTGVFGDSRFGRGGMQRREPN